MDREDKGWGRFAVLALWLLEKATLLKAAINEHVEREKERTDLYRLAEEKRQNDARDQRRVEREIGDIERSDRPASQVPTSADMEKGLGSGQKLSPTSEETLQRIRGHRNDQEEREHDKSQPPAQVNLSPEVDAVRARRMASIAETQRRIEQEQAQEEAARPDHGHSRGRHPGRGR